MLGFSLTGQEAERRPLHLGKPVLLVSGRAAQAQAVRRRGVHAAPSAVVVDSLALCQAPQADAV